MTEQINVQDLKQLMDSGNPRIIDVREEWEFNEGHLPSAIWLPMSEVPHNPGAFVAEDPVYVVCRTGNRSGQVVDWLARMDIRSVNVAGGTVEWQALGYPIDTTPAERTVQS